MERSRNSVVRDAAAASFGLGGRVYLAWLAGIDRRCSDGH